MSSNRVPSTAEEAVRSEAPLSERPALCDTGPVNAQLSEPPPIQSRNDLDARYVLFPPEIPRKSQK